VLLGTAPVPAGGSGPAAASLLCRGCSPSSCPCCCCSCEGTPDWLAAAALVACAAAGPSGCCPLLEVSAAPPADGVTPPGSPAAAVGAAAAGGLEDGRSAHTATTAGRCGATSSSKWPRWVYWPSGCRAGTGRVVLWVSAARSLMGPASVQWDKAQAGGGSLCVARQQLPNGTFMCRCGYVKGMLQAQAACTSAGAPQLVLL
jgi:hypothetical protein